MSNEKRLNKKGFTLIEILAVVVILGILLLIAVPAINKQLANFRLDYYKKLEDSIKVTGEDYVADRRYSRPTQLLYSKVIKVKDLEDEKYIDEVEDYLGNKCDNSDTSYSYVVVVKMGDKEYAYTTCLKCSQDEYATDTHEEEHDFCNIAWMTNDNIFYTDPTFDENTLYVYYGTTEKEIREQVGFTYGIEKRDADGNVLAAVPGNGEKLYPDNIGLLVGAMANQKDGVDLFYTLPNGNTYKKKAYIYTHHAPEVTATYTTGNVTTGKKLGDLYKFGSNEWANSLTIKFTFSDRDVADVKKDIDIKTIEYLDTATNIWRDTGCKLSKDKKTCTWTVASDFDKKVKFRVVNDRDRRGDASELYSIKVDATNPTCGSNNGTTEWKQEKTVSVNCLDKGGSNCSKNSFSVSYPTPTVYNKKTDNIQIYDMAGNTNACPVNIYVDSTQPSICRVTATIDGKAVANNSTVKQDVQLGIVSGDEEVDASGIASANIDVSLNGKSLGELTTTFDKDNGTYVISPTCVDRAGNITFGEKLTFILDKEINITYLGNTNTSGTMPVQVCKFNQNCTIANNAFLKTGYHFVNWRSDTASYNQGQVVKLKNDVTLKAQWEANKYTITFDGNGHTSGSTANVQCTYDQSCKLTKNGFLKTGHTFKGWSYSNNVYGNEETVKNLTTVNNGTVKMVAIWSVNSYKLTYDSNTGNACNPISKTEKYGQPWGTLCEPTKTGYTFVGWYTSPTAGDRVTAETIVRDDITVYAHWTANKYTVNFAGNKNTSGTMSSITCTYDQDCPLPDNLFLRTGYTFSGWSFNSTTYKNKGVVHNLTSAPNGSVTLTAIWTANKYRIDFKGNNNTSGNTESVTCTYDKDCTLTKNGFVRTGYTFAGWSYGSNIYINQDVVKNLTPANNGVIVMTAIWKANSYKLTYDSKGGATCMPGSKTITYDEKYGDLCSTSRVGYQFNGWFTAATGGTKVTADQTVKVTADQTIYAQWTANTYTIAFDANSGTGTMTSQTCTYDQTCTLNENKFTKTGYTYVNWLYDGKYYENKAQVKNLTSIQHGTATLRAQWSANKYTLTYVSGDLATSCEPKTITYDSKYGTLCTTKKTGYTFLGWFTAATGGTEVTADQIVKVTANQTIYAHWVPNTHKLIYNSNGGTTCTPSSRDVSYDSKYGQLCTTTRVGYTFEGWYTDPTGGTEVTSETIVRGDLTIYAHWRAHKYTISFVPGVTGTTGSTASITCTYDQNCTLTTNGFARTGYTFANWKYNSTTYVDKATVKNLTPEDGGKITMTAQWTANKYKVSFNGNKNTSGTMDSITCTYDQNCTLPDNKFERTGYTFTSWTYASKIYLNKDVVKNLTPTNNGTVTMIAMWTPNKYTLTYDSQGGTTCDPKTKTITYDSAYGPLCVPTRTGYQFAGWYNRTTDGVQVTADQIVKVVSDQTIYARWTANTYTIAFAANNGVGTTPSQTCRYDQTCTLNENKFTRTGYTFSGWSYGSNVYQNKAQVKNLTTTQNGTATLIAIWKANTYTLTYNSQGGTTCSAKTITYDSKYGPLCTPTRTGYTFQGWFTAASGGTVVTADQVVKVTNNQTIYAQWKANTYEVTFDSNGGTACTPKTKKLTYDAKYGPLCTTTRVGYTFEGWYTAASGGTLVNSESVFKGDLTIYAHWRAHKYTINFVPGVTGTTGSTASITCTYDQNCTLTANGFARTGYTWSGWSYGNNTYTNKEVVKNLTNADNGTITMTSIWKVNSYKLTYNSQGGATCMPASKTVTYDAKYGDLCSTSRVGYQFNGWFTASSGGTKVTADQIVKVASDQTIYAQWTANKYTIAFDANGGAGTIASQTCTYDQTCTLNENKFTRTGYTYVNWLYDGKYYNNKAQVKNLTSVQNGTATLKAQWKANTYTLTYEVQGGTACDPKTRNITYDSKYGTLCTTTRTGYHFVGWFTAPTGGTEVKADQIVKVTNNQTIYAQWKANTHTLTYNSNGGSACSPGSISVSYDQTYGTLCTPTRTGYTFAGWFTATTGGTQVTASTVVKGDLTVYARWNANKYTITFASGVTGTTGSTASVTCTYDQNCTLTANGFARTGYTWSSWKSGTTTYTNKQVVKNLTATNNGTIAMTAQWTANKYTIAFNGNSPDSGSMSSITCTYDQNCTLPANTFAKTGYSFAGWTNAGAILTDKQTVKNLTATNNATVTLTAIWTTNSYTLTYNNNGGANCTSVSKMYGSTWGSSTEKLCTPTRTGYTFAGWFTAASGGTQITENTRVNGNATAYARWTANKYTIAFAANGGTGTTASVTCTYDQNCTLTANGFSRTGYTWASWKSGSTTYTNKQVVKNLTATANGTVTMTAQWTANKYTITFAANGGTGTTASVTCTYDVNCTLTANGFAKTGYTWSSWKSGSTTYTNKQVVKNLTATNNGTVTMTAQWTANKYTINFAGNGNTSGSTASVTCTYDANCTLTANGFVKTGYDFAGWTYGSNTYGNAETVKNLTTASGGTITMTAIWKIKNFTLSFNGNGGTACSAKTLSYGSAYGTLCTPTRTGYTFLGWFTAASGGTQVNDKTTISAATTIYAHWSANTYTITFAANGGAGTTASVKCTYDQNCTLTANGFSRTGYDWAGWQSGSTKYTDKQVVKNLTSAANGTVTMTAQWTAHKYTITFAANGGTGTTASVTCTYDVNCTLTANGFSRTGYTWSSWKSGSTTYTNKQVVKNLTATNGGTVTMTAQWNANKYTINFAGNGNTSGSTASVTCTYDQNCTLTKNGFVKTGYTWVRWSYGSSTYTNGQTVKNLTSTNGGTITMTAVWDIITLTLSFNGNGGTTCSAKTLNYGSAYGALCTPTRAGYTFQGWFTAASGGTQVNDKTTITTNTTIYAHWSANTYTINFAANGGAGSTASIKCTYDVNCTLTANGFSKTGYTWASWAYGGATYGNKAVVKNLTSTNGGTVTMTAQWAANKYTITFAANGGTGTTANVTCTYDQNCTLTANGFSRTGYTWASWKSGSTTYGNKAVVKNLTATSGGTVTMTAQWTANKYTIKFEGNGSTSGSTASVTCTYDQNCTLTKNSFVRTGYTFTVWSSDLYNACMNSNKGDASKCPNLKAAYNDQEVVKNLTSSNGATAIMRAQWRSNPYTLTLNANGGNACSPSSKSLASGAQYGALCTPTRTGYTFDGWYTAASGGSKVSSTTTISGNTTIYAHWIANRYTVKFTSTGHNGGSMGSITCVYDVDCALPRVSFYRNYYLFSYWSYSGKTYADGAYVKNLTTTNNGTVTLTANWSGPRCRTNSGSSYGSYGSCSTPKEPSGCAYGTCSVSGCTCDTYTLTYNSAGGSSCTKTSHYIGTQYGTLCRPTRVGYDFLGWYTSTGEAVTSSTVATGNLSVTAYWKRNGQTMICKTFSCGGGLHTPSYCNYGTEGSCSCPEGQGSCNVVEFSDKYSGGARGCTCTLIN